MKLIDICRNLDKFKNYLSPSVLLLPSIESAVRCSMREVLTFILSWIVVTSIFAFTFQFDGMSFSFSSLGGFFELWGITSIFTGIYFLVIGIPILYFLFKRHRVTRKEFILAGVVASIPMLFLVLASGEIEWVIATVFSGFIGGLIFAILLPINQGT